MHPNERAIRDFYAALARRDAELMATFYDADAAFGDPVFPHLHGKDIHAMWAMLAAGAKDFTLELKTAQADSAKGSARWEARYAFSATGRPVHNVGKARFRFRDGRIAEHRDSFSFWRWSSMALGPKGVLLGWTPFLKAKVRRSAAARLAAWKSRAKR